MNPVNRRKIVEGQQLVTVLLQIFHGFWVFVPEPPQGTVKSLVSAVTGLC